MPQGAPAIRFDTASRALLIQSVSGVRAELDVFKSGALEFASPFRPSALRTAARKAAAVKGLPMKLVC